jgi:hypothetical protein
MNAVMAKSPIDSNSNKRLSINKKNIEKYIGRKLTLREKIGLSIYQKKLKQQTIADDELQKKANNHAGLGFTFSILGFALAFVYPLFLLLEIPGYIYSQRALELEKKHPNILTEDSVILAKIGKTFSFIIGIFIVVIPLLLFFILMAHYF